MDPAVAVTEHVELVAVVVPPSVTAVPERVVAVPARAADVDSAALAVTEHVELAVVVPSRVMVVPANVMTVPAMAADVVIVPLDMPRVVVAVTVPVVATDVLPMRAIDPDANIAADTATIGEVTVRAFLMVDCPENVADDVATTTRGTTCEGRSVQRAESRYSDQRSSQLQHAGGGDGRQLCRA